MGIIVSRGQSKLRCELCDRESDYVSGENDGQSAVVPAMRNQGWQYSTMGKAYCPDHAFGKGILQKPASVPPPQSEVVFAVSNDGGKTGIFWRDNALECLDWLEPHKQNMPAYCVVAVRKKAG